MTKPTPENIRVILEACPPPLADRDKAYAVLRQSFACYNSFHAVSIPDLHQVQRGMAMAQLVVDNLAAFFAGKPLLTPVNLEQAKKRNA